MGDQKRIAELELQLAALKEALAECHTAFKRVKDLYESEKANHGETSLALMAASRQSEFRMRLLESITKMPLDDAHKQTLAYGRRKEKHRPEIWAEFRDISLKEKLSTREDIYELYVEWYRYDYPDDPQGYWSFSAWERNTRPKDYL